MSKKIGFLVIFSAPSGCGKTTILTRLLKRHPEWVRSVSVTTRDPRLGEKAGKDYEFVSASEFESLKKKDQFLESAEVFGQHYGTRKKRVEDAVRKGETILLAVDVQGSRQIRQVLGKATPFFSIFILPPSLSVLRERLEHRKTDSPGEIDKRIRMAEDEIKAAREYDATVINHDLDQTVREIEELLEGFEKKLEAEKTAKKSKSSKGD